MLFVIGREAPAHPHQDSSPQGGSAESRLCRGYRQHEQAPETTGICAGRFTLTGGAEQQTWVYVKARRHMGVTKCAREKKRE